MKRSTAFVIPLKNGLTKIHWDEKAKGESGILRIPAASGFSLEPKTSSQPLLIWIFSQWKCLSLLTSFYMQVRFPRSTYMAGLRRHLNSATKVLSGLLLHAVMGPTFDVEASSALKTVPFLFLALSLCWPSMKHKTVSPNALSMLFTG